MLLGFGRRRPHYLLTPEARPNHSDHAMTARLLRSLPLLCCLLALPAAADEFLRGYASALLETQLPEFGLAVAESAEAGRVVLTGPACLSPEQRGRVEGALLTDGRLRGLEWRLPCPEPPPAAVAPTPLTLQPLPQYGLFDWLLADPREAGFNASYQYHQTQGQDFNAGDVSFGTYFAFAEGLWGRSRWQLGLQGAVFALFNLDAASTDLVNADYWIGLPLTLRQGRWSYRARLYHQSSHLGDEFLLGNEDIDRINLSYEVIDGLASYDWRRLRLYGGGGVVVRSEPTLERLLAQYGAELRLPALVGPFDLLAGADFKQLQEQDWERNISLRLGLGYRRGSRILAVLLEHYDGFSPNGQFFNVPLEYVGIGVYFGL
jgi:hypothetical protein